VARVAVVSDVHGNAPALEAVLRAIEALSPDLVVNLGCLTYGPQPREVVALLRAVSVPVLSVRGNGDRAVLEMAWPCSGRPRPPTSSMSPDSARWCSATAARAPTSS
jgi:predicted phosphodiesterase